MRAEELMVGDWVCADNIYPNENPLEKINLRIRTPLNSYGYIVAVYKEHMVDEYEDDCIYPIPITPEMLEKNGFEKGTNSYCLEISFREQIDIRECTANPDYKWIAHFSTHPFSCGAFINNVHELQHLLRDAKIEKEILL